MAYSKKNKSMAQNEEDINRLLKDFTKIHQTIFYDQNGPLENSYNYNKIKTNITNRSRNSITCS